MALTRSWTQTSSATVAVEISQKPRPQSGIVWLLIASLFVAAGLLLAYAGKTQSFDADRQRLAQGALIDLNRIISSDQLLAPLEALAGEEERREIADRMLRFLESARPLRNVGALASLRISPAEIESELRWEALRKRARFEGLARPGRSIELLPLARIKPLFVVRTPSEFRFAFFYSLLAYFAGFYLVALVWHTTRFRGDRSFLPALHLLTGIGLTLMISLRDPLRDTLEFQKFTLGVFLGCLLLMAPAIRFLDYRRLSDWCYTPLFAALALFGLLVALGRGPTGNDAKVNLGPFQPVELIKILIVLFLAGYFSRNWERLRDLREKRLAPQLFLRLGLPRVEHVLPVLCAVGLAVLFFFKLKDLGPALITLFAFLCMFGVARGRPGLIIMALVLMVGAVTLGYRLGQPHTVVDRIHIWLSPWDNDVRGGDQLAHSLWAFSTGGPWGSGPGWGDPSLIPAGHTDLVLPAIGEEWGFFGVTSVFILFSFLVWRSFRAASSASTYYGFFLALGLGSLIALEMMLITSGVLGALPLSGVVSPFLSSGNTAMMANFLVFAIILAVSADGQPRAEEASGLLRARKLGSVLACGGLVLLGFAAHYQVLRDSGYLARDVFALEQDGAKRPQHNPRLNSIAHEIPRGTIFDRNGIPLASSDWAELERSRQQYSALGVSLEQVCSRFDTRHYPFSAATAYLTGDLRTGENFHASNASLVEHDSNLKLQGFQYAELASLVRYRHEPGSPAIARVLARDRSVRLSIDIRLQVRAREILDRQLRVLNRDAGAVVVMDASSGDVLALVSSPAPGSVDDRAGTSDPAELLDRARYGQYPPGSTFKLVTAVAALNLDPQLQHRVYQCRRLPDGRAGNTIAGWHRAIKDDIGDHAHGTLDMARAIAVSCNAYFAQLGVHDVGAQALADIAARLGISTGDQRELRKMLPFAAYGQGPVLISPFKMARVAATIAARGRMPEGRWIADDSNTRTNSPAPVLAPDQADFLAAAMRRVVKEGTARGPMSGETIGIAGKTGTAQLDSGLPHAWFTGFAPYVGGEHRLAFAVLIEHGGYGARAAAPVARDVVEAARELGLL